MFPFLTGCESPCTDHSPLSSSRIVTTSQKRDLWELIRSFQTVRGNFGNFNSSFIPTHGHILLKLP